MIMSKLDDLFDKFNNSLATYIENTEYLRMLFESDHIGMCTVAKDGRFLEVNDECCRIWERPREELLNTTFQEITHPEDLEEDVNDYRKVIKSKTSHYSMAKRYIMPKGTLKPCWLEVATVPDQDGRFKMFFSKILSEESLEKMLKGVRALT